MSFELMQTGLNQTAVAEGIVTNVSHFELTFLVCQIETIEDP